MPKSHGRLNEVFSSGSSGTPVRVVKTGLAQVSWLALTARFHLWNGDDMGLKYGAIKTQKDAESAKYPQGLRARAWGIGFPFATGPAVILHLNAKTHEQAEWLSRTKPNYLLSYPSILEALAKHCLHEGIELPSLSRVHTMSEVLRPEIRRICREAWDVPVYDNYSTEETGYIALQCPKSEQLLVQSEAIYAEFLDDAGQECSAGEIGNVIVTPMHYCAMPLIRYEVGDFAEVGGKAACGRQYQVIERVLGRTRNMVRLPNGQTHYPGYQDILDGFDHAVQFQIIRRDEEKLEMKLVVRHALTKDEEGRLTAWLHERFQYPFEIAFTYHDEIPRAPSGKLLDNFSEID
ncbi:MAG: phenylacetate--CoA ligase family protein [Alphaproteobacteria bacterium]